MLTRKKLERFVRTRNESAFPSNLQFQIDASTCGFELKDLGPAKKFQYDGFTGYEWRPVITAISERCQQGQEVAWIVEFGRLLYLKGYKNPKLIDRGGRDLSELMFDLMAKVEYLPVEEETAA